MSWTQPPGSGIDIGQLDDLVKGKFNAHVCLGAATDDELPGTVAELTALMSGVGQKFVPLGDLHAEGIEWSWEQEKIEMHAGDFGGALKFSGMLKTSALTKDAIDWSDSREWDDEGGVTLLLVPFNLPAAAPFGLIALSGLQVVDDGEIRGNMGFPALNFKFSAEPDKLGEVLKYISITA